MTPLFVKVEVDDRTIEFAVDRSWLDPIADLLAARRFPTSRSNELWRHLIRPGSRVVDVGAHLGTYSLPAAALGAQVLAVEASAPNATLLKLAAERNGLGNVEILHAAADRHSGTIGFKPAGPWGQVMFAHELAAGQLGLPTPAVALDEVLEEREWEHVDLIKIDIEGSEVEALAGMYRCLARQQAPQVIIEVNGHALHQYGHDPREALAELEQRGYRSYLIDPPPGHLLVPVDSTDLQPETVADYIAFKEVPERLAPWSIGPRLERPDVIRRVVATCTHDNLHHRQYGARLLVDGPDWLLEDESIAELRRSAQVAPLIVAAGGQRSKRRGAALHLMGERADLVGFGLSTKSKGVGRVSMWRRDRLRRTLFEVFFRQTEFNRSSGELIRGHETELEALGATVRAQLNVQAGVDERVEELERRLARLEVNSAGLARRGGGGSGAFGAGRS